MSSLCLGGLLGPENPGLEQAILEHARSEVRRDAMLLAAELGLMYRA